MRLGKAQQTEAELKAREAALQERMRELKRKDECRRQPKAARLVNDVESLKVPDTPDSPVASYICKCGAEISQFIDRVVGTCVCGRAKPIARVRITQMPARQGMGNERPRAVCNDAASERLDAVKSA
jgi:hypothetical protein